MNDLLHLPSASPRLHATKRKLLDAAGPIFAADGYEGASVRAICSVAGANVAAIKYHFGHKLGLYQAVLRSANAYANERYPYPTAADPTVRLTALIRCLMERILDPGRPAWHTRLMSREMTDPSPSFALIVEEMVRPLMTVLDEVVRDLLPPTTPAEDVRLYARSVLGQCLFYRHAAPMLRQLMPGDDQAARIDAITGHITRFSLAGLGAREALGATSTP